MFSSEDMDAITPQDFFEQLNTEFEFEIDLAASEKNTKCEYYYDEEANSLVQPWEGRCWCNPPYGRGILSWVSKAAEESAINGSLVVMLLPARTDTKWFAAVAESADEIRFIKGRLHFEGQPANAPFPSMVAIWFGHHVGWKKCEPGPYQYNLIWRRR